MFSKIKKNILAGSVAIATTAMAGTVSAGAMVALLLPENVKMGNSRCSGFCSYNGGASTRCKS